MFNMKLLIFCFIFTVCSAYDFDCLKGPEFWCKDISNAQKCGKVTECFLENKIKKESVNSQEPSQSFSYCSFCLEIVEVMIKKVETKQQFVDFIQKEICENLQGEIQNVCKLLVSQFGPLVFDKIKNDMNAQIICKFIKFCDSKSVLTKVNINDFSKTDICTRCKEFFHVIQSVFEKITPQEIKFILDNFLCTQLPSEFQSMCKMLVDGYTDQLYELIKSLLDGDRICPLIHLCSTGLKPFLGSWNCATCVDVIAVLRKDLINVSESQLEKFAKSAVCSKLSYIERLACNKLVSNYAPAFYKDLHSSATAQQLCKKNGLCLSPNPFSFHNIQKMKGAECTACQFVVNQIKKFLSDPAIQDKIKTFMKNVLCNIIPSEKARCQQFVDGYFSAILNFLIKELDADKVCHIMNFCSSKMTGIECSVCEAVVNEVTKVAFSNRTEQVMATFVNTKICPILGNIKDECVVLVNTYLPILFSLARSTLNSRIICVELKLCTVFTKEEIKYAMRNFQNGDVPCEICLLVINETYSLLSNPNIQNAIQDLIKNYICKLMPNPQSCANDIDIYFSMVINVILEFLNPALCTEFHLCNARNSFTKFSQSLLTIKNSVQNNNKECHLCSKFYDYLKSILGRKYPSNVVMGLISICNQLDNHDKLRCLKQFQNLRTVIKSFNKSTSLGQFCTMTAMCSGDDHVPQHLGKNSCSWGPGFWCISQWHASSCGPGAVKHCEMNVWNKMPRKP